MCLNALLSVLLASFGSFMVLDFIVPIHNVYSPTEGSRLLPRAGAVLAPSHKEPVNVAARSSRQKR
jgi:hypothetical protein